MAAQKLTRGRFVQIIIMLTLLITAFFWRTVTHESTLELSCEAKKECVFYADNTRFSVQLGEGNMLIETDKEGWILEPTSPESTLEKNALSWSIFFPKYNNEITIKLSSPEGEQKAITIRRI